MATLKNKVIFLRGSKEDYESLETKDKDTLYFIIGEDDLNEIYLGDELFATMDFKDLKNAPYIPTEEAIQIILEKIENKQDKLTDEDKIAIASLVDLSAYIKTTDADNKYQLRGNYLTSKDIENKVDKISGKGLSTKDFTLDYENAVKDLIAGKYDNKINVNELNSYLNKIEYPIETIIHDGPCLINPDTGELYHEGDSLGTEYISDFIKVTRPLYVTGYTTYTSYIAIALYDENKNYLKDKSYKGDLNLKQDLCVKNVIITPEDCSYIKVASRYTNNSDYRVAEIRDYSLFYDKIKNLGFQIELTEEDKKNIANLADVPVKAIAVNGEAQVPDENGQVDLIIGSILEQGNGIVINENIISINEEVVAKKDEIPVIYDWAKQENKPVYTANEVGALPDTTVIPNVPTNVSAFVNDANYLTEHQSLEGYAKESWVENKNYATKEDLANLKHFKVVAELPDPENGETPDATLIYLVSNGTTEEGNIYNEYIWAEKDGGHVWEFLGSNSVDLSGYVKEKDFATINNEKITQGGNIEIQSAPPIYIGGTAEEATASGAMLWYDESDTGFVIEYPDGDNLKYGTEVSE